MKKLLFTLTLCLLCAPHAFGQYMGLANAEPQPLIIATHEQHASQQGIGTEKSLLITGYNAHEHGMRPLYELAPVKIETPLGDIARTMKKQHEGSKKADIVWEN